jgi:hypothetical protein
MGAEARIASRQIRVKTNRANVFLILFMPLIIQICPRFCKGREKFHPGGKEAWYFSLGYAMIMQ